MRYYVNLKSYVNDYVNIFKKKCRKYEFSGIPYLVKLIHKTLKSENAFLHHLKVFLHSLEFWELHVLS